MAGGVRGRLNDPRERQMLEARLLALCERRQITVTRRGMAYDLRGYGVDLAVIDLLLVTAAELGAVVTF